MIQKPHEHPVAFLVPFEWNMLKELPTQFLSALYSLLPLDSLVFYISLVSLYFPRRYVHPSSVSKFFNNFNLLLMPQDSDFAARIG